jgi:hypothetical protein
LAGAGAANTHGATEGRPVIDRQHVWVGPEATSFEVPCEACLAKRGGWEDNWGRELPADIALIEGTLRRDADVGFTTCRRGHRIVVRRVGRRIKFH